MQQTTSLDKQFIKIKPRSEMNKFEAVLLISPDTSSNGLSDNIKLFEDTVSNNSGKVISSEDWGLRDLSYDISNVKKAFYKYFQLELDGNNIKQITKILNQNDIIIRHLFIKVDQHQELPTKLNYEKN